MSRKTIGALFLDVGNVLLDFDHSITWRAIAGEANVPWQEVRDHLVAGGLARSFDLGRLAPLDLFSHVAERFGLSIGPDEFFSLWADIFTPREEVLALLPSLADLLPLYLLSNTDPVHFAHIERSYSFTGIFRERILSFEVGARKPDPAIYHVAVRRAGIPPGQCLFFDDLKENVFAARSTGIKAHQFTGVAGMVEVLRECGIEAGEGKA